MIELCSILIVILVSRSVYYQKAAFHIWLKIIKLAFKDNRFFISWDEELFGCDYFNPYAKHKGSYMFFEDRAISDYSCIGVLEPCSNNEHFKRISGVTNNLVLNLMDDYRNCVISHRYNQARLALISVNSKLSVKQRKSLGFETDDFINFLCFLEHVNSGGIVINLENCCFSIEFLARQVQMKISTYEGFILDCRCFSYDICRSFWIWHWMLQISKKKTPLVLNKVKRGYLSVNESVSINDLYQLSADKKMCESFSEEGFHIHNRLKNYKTFSEILASVLVASIGVNLRLNLLYKFCAVSFFLLIIIVNGTDSTKFRFKLLLYKLMSKAVPFMLPSLFKGLKSIGQGFCGVGTYKTGEVGRILKIDNHKTKFTMFPNSIFRVYTPAAVNLGNSHSFRINDLTILLTIEPFGDDILKVNFQSFLYMSQGKEILYMSREELKSAVMIFRSMENGEFSGVSEGGVKVFGLYYLHLLSPIEILRRLEGAWLGNSEVWELRGVHYASIEVKIDSDSYYNCKVSGWEDNKSIAAIAYYTRLFWNDDSLSHRIIPCLIKSKVLNKKWFPSLPNAQYKRFVSGLSQLYKKLGVSQIYRTEAFSRNDAFMATCSQLEKGGGFSLKIVHENKNEVTPLTEIEHEMAGIDESSMRMCCVMVNSSLEADKGKELVVNAGEEQENKLEIIYKKLEELIEDSFTWVGQRLHLREGSEPLGFEKYLLDSKIKIEGANRRKKDEMKRIEYEKWKGTFPNNDEYMKVVTGPKRRFFKDKSTCIAIVNDICTSSNTHKNIMLDYEGFLKGGIVEGSSKNTKPKGTLCFSVNLSYIDREGSKVCRRERFYSNKDIIVPANLSELPSVAFDINLLEVFKRNFSKNYKNKKPKSRGGRKGSKNKKEFQPKRVKCPVRCLINKIKDSYKPGKVFGKNEVKLNCFTSKLIKMITMSIGRSMDKRIETCLRDYNEAGSEAKEKDPGNEGMISEAMDNDMELRKKIVKLTGNFASALI